MIIVISKNSCPAASVTMLHPTQNALWLLLCYLRVRFQLASPPGFHFNTHPRGELCIYVYEYVQRNHLIALCGAGSALGVQTDTLEGTLIHPFIEHQALVVLRDHL